MAGMRLPRAFVAASALVLAGAALAACGDDGEAGTSGTVPDTTEAETTTTTTEDDEAPALDDAAACAEAVRDAAPTEALAAFPDNAEVTWTVQEVEEGGLGMQLAEMEPDSEEVGYRSFRMVFGCGDGEPVLLAIYALDGEEYVLLSTTDAAQGTEFDPVLEE
jgi:hypothetical protein